MKRLTLLAILATAAAFAASNSETATYVDGNVAGVSPNTGGTLTFSDEKAMIFRTGLSNVPVPYSGISNVELGAVKETSHDVPFYKVWQLHKRFSGGNKTETQLLIVSFKNEDGEDKSMTLELAQPAVTGVLATIEEHTGKTYVARSQGSPKHGPAKATNQATSDDKNAWWGDDYWKTTRNADKWNKSAGSNNNNNQQ